jgi:hypothetical protein
VVPAYLFGWQPRHTPKLVTVGTARNKHWMKGLACKWLGWDTMCYENKNLYVQRCIKCNGHIYLNSIKRLSWIISMFWLHGSKQLWPCLMQYLNRGRHIFENPKSHLKLLGTKMIARSNLNTYGPQILGATAQNSVAQATCYMEFVKPWSRPTHW